MASLIHAHGTIGNIGKIGGKVFDTISAGPLVSHLNLTITISKW
jgi:hypothetical protein